MSEEQEANQELELYKLITENNLECGWSSETEFFVFPYLFELNNLIKGITGIFGTFMFDDGGVEARILDGYICIDLAAMLSGADIDLERIFPRDEFKH